jgi:hypothetical protein
MKTKLSLLACASILSSQFCVAQSQPPVDDWKPAPSNQAGKQFPQVNSEGRVKFRINAPRAQSVGVSFRDSSAFTKGEDGAWTGHTRPLDEGLHYYTINIDGAEVPDPNSHYFYGAGRWGSAVEVPARDADFYTVKNCRMASACAPAPGEQVQFTPSGRSKESERSTKTRIKTHYSTRIPRCAAMRFVLSLRTKPGANSFSAAQ